MSTNSTYPPAQPVITPDNHSAYVTITLLLLTILSVMFYGFRLVIRFGFGFFASDDLMLTAGTVLMIAQVSATGIAIKSGLGRRKDILTSDQVQQVEVAMYVATILYVVVMTLAKMSASQLTARLTRQTTHARLCAMVSVATAVWGLVSLLTIAIVFAPGKSWDQAADLHIVWYFVCGLGVLIEVVLIAIPTRIVCNMQLPISSKIMVLTAFSFRLPIIAISIWRMLCLVQLRHVSDITFALVKPTLLTQADMHYALVSATIPCMRPFLKALGSGYSSTEAAQVDRTLATGRGKEGMNSTRSTRSYAGSIPLEDRFTKRSQPSTRASVMSERSLHRSSLSSTLSSPPVYSPNMSAPKPRFSSIPPQLPSTIVEESRPLSLEPCISATIISQQHAALTRSRSSISEPESHSSFGSQRQMVQSDSNV